MVAYRALAMPVTLTAMRYFLIGLLIGAIVWWLRALRGATLGKPLAKRKPEAAVEDQWNSYETIVEGQPAAIHLNLAYREQPASPALPNLYSLETSMQTSDEPGIGGTEESEEIYAIEQALRLGLVPRGFVAIGRVRHDGICRIHFYGPKNGRATFDRAVSEVLLHHQRKGKVQAKHDPEWSYYFDFLLPDADRLVWMLNRDQVEVILEHGAQPNQPLPVEHQLSFESAGQAGVFRRKAQSMGFEAQLSRSDESKEIIWVNLAREEPIELEHLHALVMKLTRLGQEYNGEYRGWGCVVTP